MSNAGFEFSHKFYFDSKRFILKYCGVQCSGTFVVKTKYCFYHNYAQLIFQKIYNKQMSWYKVMFCRTLFILMICLGAAFCIKLNNVV